MRADFEQSINNLIAASGGRVWLVSGTRDTATQRRLWEEKLAEYGLPPDTDPDDPRAAQARKYVAPPGYSNHERGIAADLGGDLVLAKQLAPQFGLWLPMSWEPWHFEPVGSREEGSPSPYTTPPLGHAAPGEEPRSQDYNAMFERLLGTGPRIFSPRGRLITQNRTSAATMALDPDRVKAPVFTTSSGGPDGIDKFMQAIKDIESSGGNYKAIGPMTRYGTAKGAYQFLDSTWAGYGGYATADEAPPEVQDRKARELMQEYYNQFGSWDNVAAAWFSGPNGNWQSGEVQRYVQKVRSRL